MIGARPSGFARRYRVGYLKKTPTLLPTLYLPSTTINPPAPLPTTDHLPPTRIPKKMMMFRIPALLLSLALGASAAGVVPQQIAVKQKSKREVWAPPITEPDANTVWYTGTTVTVSWYV